MRRFLKAIYSNKFLAFLMLLLQILVFAAAYIWLNDSAKYVYGGSAILSAILVIYEINNTKDSPEFKMTWLALVGVVPVFGALLYVYLRMSSLSRSIGRYHKTVHNKISESVLYDDKTVSEIKTTEPEFCGLVNYLIKSDSAFPYSDAEIKYYDLGEKMYTDIKSEMEGAKKFIFLEFFIVNCSSSMWKEIFDILCRKVREGVEVRFMYDGMGSSISTPKNLSEILDKAGIKHTIFSPVVPLLSTHQNNRDHRKIIVVDGKTAFTGGINIADEYVNRKDRFGHWKDNGIKISGLAVNKLTAMFLEMWGTASPGGVETEYVNISEYALGASGRGYVIPYGDCPLDDEKVGKRVYIDIINTARDYVYIMTPYLIPDGEVIEAMRYAVNRGVDVKIIIPHHPDKVYAYWLAHTYFPELIKDGVEIYEYTPGFIHAKTVVSDDKKAVVGTINFDYRSFFLHYECAVYMYKTKSVFDIKSDFNATREISQRITQEEYKHFNLMTKMIGRLIRIVAPLL